MRSLAVLLACLFPAAQSCSYVEVPVKDRHAVNGTKYIIGRTLEYGNLFNVMENRIAVHPRGEHGGRYGFVSLDSHLNLLPLKPVWVPLEGMNEASLTISGHILQESQYEKPLGLSKDVTSLLLVPSLLRACGSVEEALAFLEEHRVVMAQSKFGIHWSLADGTGRSVMLEYVRGQRNVWEGVRVMTNDPPLDFHLRNLNTYVNLNPSWPDQNDFLATETEVGTVPQTHGHGWNLFGLPGDSSPVSRFAQLFYLRGYAQKFNRPKSVDDAVVLTTGLLNKVFIPIGTVSREQGSLLDNYDYTMLAVIKIPSEKRLMVRGYRNMRWRQVDLTKVDFTKKTHWPVEDGSLGVEDITLEGLESEEEGTQV